MTKIARSLQFHRATAAGRGATADSPPSWSSRIASEVTLEKPTSSPRLNQVILDALKQWKFFPALHNGVAIESSFEVRIPISVQ